MNAIVRLLAVYTGLSLLLCAFTRLEWSPLQPNGFGQWFALFLLISSAPSAPLGPPQPFRPFRGGGEGLVPPLAPSGTATDNTPSLIQGAPPKHHA